MRLPSAGCFLAAFLCASSWCGAADLRHPLDALTADEYWTVFETMKASRKLDAASRYAGVNLHEPPKTAVLHWKPGDPFRREALAYKLRCRVYTQIPTRLLGRPPGLAAI
jgi:Cu2+-containing amine oxidase